MATLRLLLRTIAGIALLASATDSQAQLVPRAVYSGSGSGGGQMLGATPSADHSAQRTTRLIDADMSRLIKPYPSYSSGKTTTQ